MIPCSATGEWVGVNGVGIPFSTREQTDGNDGSIP